MDINTISSHPIHQIIVNDTNYAYIEKGTGPVIVFLHGFPDLANTWDDIIEEFSKDYRCIAPFLTGYYPSGIASDGNYTPKRVAEDIKGLLDQLGIDTFIVIGQDWDDDVRVVLFVVLQPGTDLADGLQDRIRKTVRAKCSPRHVPAKIIQVSEIPRTKSGKIVELAVRDVVHDRIVKNIHSLANPEALDLYRNLPQLQD